MSLSRLLESLLQSKSRGVALAFATGCTFFLAGVALSQTSPKATNHIDFVIQSPDQERAVRWNEGRLRNAKPLPIPVAKTTPGAPKPVPPSGPRSAGPGESGPAHNVGAADKMTGDPNSYPLRWAGKFFFSKPGEGDYICSAQFIAPRIVLTAAHCVRDDNTGQWYRDFEFDLQYERGKTTQKLTPKCFATWSGWVHGSSDDDDRFWHFDYAMLLTGEDSKTGNFGWQYNYDPAQYPKAYKVGYPADILDGEVIQVDGGPLTAPETRPGLVRLEHGNPNNTGGSSGGAWVGNYSTSLTQDSNRVISVTSHHVNDETTVSFGPEFDQNFKGLMDFVQRGCK
ncbi:MAG TPA: trypsin-like serine protease [Xanthobacteraceae bacterium]|nr:trypsin-like serine protease [Xanthobacteraceae bacterium]